jgi:hypothetical protein
LKVLPTEIWLDVGVFLPPPVPRVYALFKNLKMLRVTHGIPLL